MVGLSIDNNEVISQENFLLSSIENLIILIINFTFSSSFNHLKWIAKYKA